MAKPLLPIHPGETIREDCLLALEMSVNQLAKHLKITAARLNDIVRGPPRHYRRHRAASGALLRNYPGVLDGARIALRPGGRPAKEPHPDPPRSEAPNGYSVKGRALKRRCCSPENLDEMDRRPNCPLREMRPHGVMVTEVCDVLSAERGAAVCWC
jgi:hypothetical protein